MNALSLSELNLNVKKTLSDNFYESYHIVAEISEMRESGPHAYLELIEKNEAGKILAKVRATIWASVYGMLKTYFKSVTGNNLEAGLKVLVVVSVEFHEIYGYSLNIRDIDPTYTLGDIEKQRLETIKKLEDDGIIDMNKEVNLSHIPQKIAIISSEKAAGYGDFINQLHNNKFEYKFYTKLFPATVQGEYAEESIINAFDKIYEHEDFFDAVVLIRGGGSKIDLSCFDSYLLAVNISQFPLPVITGIGHDRDESIADLVAHTSVKTPTAAAEFLIDKLYDFDTYVSELQDNFIEKTKDFLNEKKSEIEYFALNFKPIVNDLIHEKHNKLNFLSQKLVSETKASLKNEEFNLLDKFQKIKASYQSMLRNEQRELDNFSNKINISSKRFLINKNHKINIFEEKIKYLSPENILKRGYSYTLYKGKIVKDKNQIKKGDIIETHLFNGNFKSKIQ